MHKLTYKPFGKQAVLIEWNASIDKNILNDILLFKEKLRNKKPDLYTDLIVGYNSLTIKYKEKINNFLNEVEYLKSIYKIDFQFLKKDNFIWEIPVCYDTKFGVDLEEISTKSNLSIQEIIKLHSEKIYTVFFIGFLPGFLYLGGLDSKLFFNRKPNPRLKVAKGTVAIGGEQTGIYPSESAGGWNIIGLTPINFFDVQKENPCFAKAGDQIKFKQISLKEFIALEKEVEKSNYIISKKVIV
ncbi:5-oxoprolinase subunit PxpB [uncultured Polaribacter sp.]|uniref:5-oxoprolinase subunit PxpB n=1 Tax=uncultured Polaribacter sp. TaxID=174711 RepID=UPI0026077098|nr:5-oxoprolinase subunit PxpB [uncultured Polaribacter sp.]